MKLLSQVLIPLSFLLLISAQAAAPKTIVMPNIAYERIQDAVLAVANNGTIKLSGGDYYDKIDIPAHKTVTILGQSITVASPAGATLNQLPATNGYLFRVNEGSKLVIKNLVLVTPEVAIVGAIPSTATSPRGSIDLNTVRMSGGATGISGHFDTVLMKGCSVTSQINAGLQLIVRKSISIDRSDISNNGTYGLVAVSSDPTSTQLVSCIAKNSTFLNNGAQGVHFSGANIRGQVINSSVWGNTFAGISAWKASVSLNAVDVGGTLPNSSSVGGDGVFFQGGTLLVKNSTIYSNAQAGILSLTCSNVNGFTSKLSMSGSLISQNNHAVVADIFSGCTGQVSMQTKFSTLAPNYCYPYAYSPILGCTPINDGRTPPLSPF